MFVLFHLLPLLLFHFGCPLSRLHCRESEWRQLRAIYLTTVVLFLETLAEKDIPISRPVLNLYKMHQRYILRFAFCYHKLAWRCLCSRPCLTSRGSLNRGYAHDRMQRLPWLPPLEWMAIMNSHGKHWSNGKEELLCNQLHLLIQGDVFTEGWRE